MILPDKPQRNQINLDSFERAIIWSALLIRQGIRIGLQDQTETPTMPIVLYQNFVSYDFSSIDSETGEEIIVTETLPSIIIEAKMPYESISFLETGGNFLNVKTINDTAPTYTGDALPPSLLLPINEPSEVETLEQYFVWVCTKWIRANATTNTYSPWESYGYFSFLEDANPPSIILNLTMPLNYTEYLRSKNLIQSVTSTLIIASSDELEDLIPDAIAFGDNYLVGD